MANEISFFLNGEKITLQSPSPNLMLVDYLRSPEVGLTGTKKPCGQGGCGGCTVILSSWNGSQAVHRAINSCLRPVCALSGLAVTTIEGTGTRPAPSVRFLAHAPTVSRGGAPLDAPPAPAVAAAMADARSGVHWSRSAPTSVGQSAKAQGQYYEEEQFLTGMNPVAHALAMHNGSQCGYCSVGFVMNMSEFFVSNSKSPKTGKVEATKQQIEDIFDGNLCRCTGYRTILTGMKSFASDWIPTEDKTIRCLQHADSASQEPAASPNISSPQEASALPPPPPTILDPVSGVTWATPADENALTSLLNDHTKKFRLVHGNTSFGIYKDEYFDAQTLIDIRSILPKLGGALTQKSGSWSVSAGISYSDLIAGLDGEIHKNSLGDASSLSALKYMARRTAGRIVRNAGSLGGNTMLVLQHIREGEPFPSDIFTTLVAIDAKITYRELKNEVLLAATTKTARELAQAVAAVTPTIEAKNLLLLSYELPITPANRIVLAQKVALREVNSHTLVNATTVLEFDPSNKVTEAGIVFGGIAPYPWHASGTEAKLKALKGLLAFKDLHDLCKSLEDEVTTELLQHVNRMASLPNEGITGNYRVQLAVSFLYKALVNAMTQRGIETPALIRSSGDIPWGKWPQLMNPQKDHVTPGQSGGVQDYKKYDPTKYEPNKPDYKVGDNMKAPTGEPYIKSSAMYQTAGLVHYTQELATPPRTLNAAFVQSRRALAKYTLQVPGGTVTGLDQLKAHLHQKFPAFVDFVDHNDIPKGIPGGLTPKNPGINKQGMGMDQPVFAEGLVLYVGQSIGLVLAQSEQHAAAIADYVSRKCVSYSSAGWTGNFATPFLTLEDAITKGSIFPDAPTSSSWVSHIWKIRRPGSDLKWVASWDTSKVDLLHKVENAGKVMVGTSGTACVLVKASQLTGGQAHFYMETQACIAEPRDEGRVTIRPSSQSPMEMHESVAMVLGVHYNHVDVQVAPLGGGFGGKTEQARFVAAAAAVAARKTQRPVRLAMPRDEDTAMIGKRHAYFGQCQVAIEEATGKIHGFHAKMWGDGGAFYDCSYIVSNCIQLRADNAYNVANFESEIDVCRTNTAPSTAMRSFGDIQAKNIIENAIEDAAVSIKIPSDKVRESNFYQPGNKTPFDQTLPGCYIKDVWQYLKKKCEFEKQVDAVNAFNKANRWRKRGISILPVKYGSGYNLKLLEQATAVLSVNKADGTVVIHQGGVEMGQGLVTQALQVASQVLNIPMEMIQIEPVKTSVIPNPSSSGASTGTPYACEVTKRLCNAFITELIAEWAKFPVEERPELGAWATAAASEGTKVDTIVDDWQKLIRWAFSQRLPLVKAFTHPMKEGDSDKPISTMFFKPIDEQPHIPGVEVDETAKPGGGVDSFAGFTYSAACSVVEVDILTGETKLLRSDIVYDMGWSLNPALDIGQVEGAFMQGVGYLTSEQLVFEQSGDEQGRLNTTNTWRYKIPAHTAVPLEFNVYLFPRSELVSPPDDLTTIHSAKEVGEPPVILANTVFFAIKAAIRASREERGLSNAALFRLDAPATVQEVRRACDVKVEHLAIPVT